MSRIYSVDEFEEESGMNNPNGLLTLAQIANLDDDLDDDEIPQMTDSQEDEEDDDAELRIKSLCTKLNPHPVVPGELSKPQSLFFEKEIRTLLRETKIQGDSRGVHTVVYEENPPSPPPPIPIKKKHKGKKKKKPPKAEEVIVISSSSDVEFVPETKFSKLVINPVAISKEKKASSTVASGSRDVKDSKSSLPENSEVVVIPSEKREKKPPRHQKIREPKENKFFSPKELYEMKMGQ